LFESGVVEAVGDKCVKIKPGDEVIGVVRSGALAQFVAAPEYQWVRKPETLSHLHGAAFPYSGVLAFQALFVHGNLKENEKVLILNGSGGVGSMAVQMARYKQAFVFATTSDHMEAVRELGADVVLDYRKCNWWERLDSENIDLIVDFGVGYAAYFHSSRVLNPKTGRFISIVPDYPDGPVSFWNHNIVLPLRGAFDSRFKFVDDVDLSNYRHLSYIAKMIQQKVDDLKPVLDMSNPYEFDQEGVEAMFDKLTTKETRGKLILKIGKP